MYMYSRQSKVKIHWYSISFVRFNLLPAEVAWLYHVHAATRLTDKTTLSNSITSWLLLVLNLHLQTSVHLYTFTCIWPRTGVLNYSSGTMFMSNNSIITTLYIQQCRWGTLVVLIIVLVYAWVNQHSCFFLLLLVLNQPAQICTTQTSSHSKSKSLVS